MNGGIQPTVELATNNGAYPVYPVMYGNNGYGNGGFFGGDGIWAIVLLALLFNNGGWGGFGGNGNNDFAWLSNGQKDIMTNTNNGFDTLHLSNQLEGNRDAINGISNQICNSTADVTSAVNNGFYNLNTSLLNCCCENRLASCQTQNTIVSEAAATRFADANNTRDIITSQTQGTQAILDKLCQLELDGVKAQVEAKNDRINDLQRELSMADLRASQTAQNAFISQGFANEVDALYNRLSNCPVPSTPVYGRTPIFTCNNGCGCGMGTTSQFI
jgi:hypothetical protein